MALDTSGGRKAAMERALKNARNAYKKADSAGEILEREIKRVLQNKRVYSAATVEKLMALHNDFKKLVEASSFAMSDFVTVYMEVIG